MKIDANKLFIATMLIFAISWVLCAALVMMFPRGMITLTGHMVHGNLEGMVWSMTASGFFVGLFAWSIFAGVIVWLIASIYNKLAA